MNLKQVFMESLWKSICKWHLHMYKEEKEIFNGRFLLHKDNRNFNIPHTLSLNPEIHARFERPLVLAEEYIGLKVCHV